MTACLVAAPLGEAGIAVLDCPVSGGGKGPADGRRILMDGQLHRAYRHDPAGGE